MKLSVLENRPAGYLFLIKAFDLKAILPHHHSFVSLSTTQHQRIEGDEHIEEMYPKRYWPGDRVYDHLSFALKYDGVHLGLLSQIFEKIDQEGLCAYLKSKINGKYIRRIWFFYEFLNDALLAIDDLQVGNYIDALDEQLYYCIQEKTRSPRHRIFNNLIGQRAFCPMVRKTEKLKAFEEIDIYQKCEEMIKNYDPLLIRRALGYLYQKETKSSFEIESVKASSSRIETFIASLAFAEKEDFCQKDKLIGLQNQIVEFRFKDSDYRKNQNYIGQSIAYQKEFIHFICPKPEDIFELMDGLMTCHQTLKKDKISAMLHVAVISYGFVFLHPFEDGNGRIHRFLIHNILCLRKMIPKGIIFPISAVMLKNPIDYNQSLESFSRPLLQLIDYQIDEIGQMEVKNHTKHLYQYMDLTQQVEYLYGFVIKTIEEELVEELDFLMRYDLLKKKIQEIIDMPDRLIDLFIKLCSHHQGTLSARKRADYFDFLTDQELTEMQTAFQMIYLSSKSTSTP
jgi:hypothetical protein